MTEQGDEAPRAGNEAAARLRLGLSSGALYPDVPTEEVPAVAARWGLTDLELMPQTRGEYEPSFVRRVAANCRAAGCRVHAVHSWQAMHPVLSPYRRRAQEARADFDRVIEAAAAWGARVIVWHGPHREEVTAPEQWDRFVAAAGELAAACHEAGLTLALENVSWCALPTVRDVIAFAARLPELGPPEAIGFAFDAYQAAAADANPFMILAAMEGRLVDVHLSDHREEQATRRRLLPGDGDLPWPALLRAVAAAGYRGPLMIEGLVEGDPARLGAVRARLDPLLAELAATPADPCAGTPPPGVREGIRLFNEGAFYECHEAIEHEWHAERGPIRRLYQGILQIGVGFHHARGGNHRGAVLLLTDGIEKTAGFLPRCLGLDTARLVRESRLCLDQIVSLGPERLGEFDWSLVPRVHPAAGSAPASIPS